MAPDTSSPLFLTRLLPELRLKVYEHVVYHHRPIALKFVDGHLTRRKTRGYKPPGLLRVNRQVRDETIALLNSETFYLHNTFTMLHYDIVPVSFAVASRRSYARRPAMGLPDASIPQPSNGVHKFLKKLTIESVGLGPVYYFASSVDHLSYHAPKLEQATFKFERSGFLLGAAVELSRACTLEEHVCLLDRRHHHHHHLLLLLLPNQSQNDDDESQDQTAPPTLSLSISVMTADASAQEVIPRGLWRGLLRGVTLIEMLSSRPNFDNFVQKSRRATPRYPPLIATSSLKQITLVGNMPDCSIPIIEGYKCQLSGSRWMRTSVTHVPVKPRSGLSGTHITYVWSRP
ncbi:hypothetical protein PV08_07572 [Exophiala spinifera]|uniref:Uncharacterized protein n=1 Tax=Exophiala spinifera TaxID=91928 RepID=A0A0D1ZPP0_9EURO|nr:uncharacterized protein PV08_07572 [Exophiala spinifera]KIW14787.1 hypothetical protein PV08_07572 [Exophiala spinifera]